MHDSLPLQLLSRQPIVAAFEGRQGQEFFVLFPWYLMVAGLTHLELSTEARGSMFELAFWVLYRVSHSGLATRFLIDIEEK
jgi:hypothetical protein